MSLPIDHYRGLTAVVKSVGEVDEDGLESIRAIIYTSNILNLDDPLLSLRINENG